MSLDAWFLLTPQLIIASGIVLSLLLIAWQRTQKLIAYFSLVTITLALVSSIQLLGAEQQSITPLMRIDEFSRIAFIWVLLASFVGIGFSLPVLKQHIEVHDEYYLLILLVVLGGGVLVASDHFASLFLGFELLSIALVGLAGYFRQSPFAVEVGFKYLVLSASASSFMLLGIAFLYSQTGTLSFDVFGKGIANADSQLISQMGFLLFISGIAFKLSLVPFHFWTPDVYQGSPTPVTFTLATISKCAMFVVLAKCFYIAGLNQIALTDNIYFVLSSLAVFSMIIGNSLAIGQHDLKRLLAYSSIAHMGYLFIVLLLHAESEVVIAKQAILFYLFAYLVANVGLFAVMLMTEKRNKVGNITLSHWRGLFWHSPLQGVVVIFSVLSFAGMPLTIGFIGKFYLITVAANQQLWWLLTALIVGSGIALSYYLPIIFQLFGESLEADKNNQASEPIWQRTWLFSIILLSIGLGIFPDHLTNLLANM